MADFTISILRALQPIIGLIRHRKLAGQTQPGRRTWRGEKKYTCRSEWKRPRRHGACFGKISVLGQYRQWETVMGNRGEKVDYMFDMDTLSQQNTREKGTLYLTQRSNPQSKMIWLCSRRKEKPNNLILKEEARVSRAGTWKKSINVNV